MFKVLIRKVNGVAVVVQMIDLGFLIFGYLYSEILLFYFASNFLLILLNTVLNANHVLRKFLHAEINFVKSGDWDDHTISCSSTISTYRAMQCYVPVLLKK